MRKYRVCAHYFGPADEVGAVDGQGLGAVRGWHRVGQHLADRGYSRDFCCTSPVFKMYRCANFSSKGKAVFARGGAIGSWAAWRKWAGLTERAVREFLRRHRVARHEVPAVRAQLEEISRLFAKHLLL